MATYRRRGDFPSIGENYYEGVWYKITNPEALYKEKDEDEALRNPFNNMQNFMTAAAHAIRKPKGDNLMIGSYAREPFNSVKVYITGRDSFDEEGKIEWHGTFFVDTRKYGEDKIIVSTSKEEVIEKVSKVLKASGAVLDDEKLKEEIDKHQKSFDEEKRKINFLNCLWFEKRKADFLNDNFD